MRFRLPLPAKVLLSYLAVLAAGAIPAFVWVQFVLVDRLAEQGARELAHETSAVAAVLVGTALNPEGLSPEANTRLREISVLVGERVSLIGPTGALLFESQPKATVVARTSAEVIASRGGAPAERALFVNVPEVIVARDQHEIGAAIALGNSSGGKMTLRMARDARPLQVEVRRALDFFRNALAGSLSVALLFTFISVILLFKPLQRLRSIAKEMGDGDLSPPKMKSYFGEIDDASEALGKLGTSIRRRLAGAGSGEAMIDQLVEAVPSPLLLFELKSDEDGDGSTLFERVIAVNGPGRRFFCVDGPSAARRCRSLLDDRDFRRALRDVDDQGVPVKLEIPIDDSTVSAYGFVLKRPAMSPIFCLLGDGEIESDAIEVPSPDEVVTRGLEELFTEAHGKTAAAWADAGVLLSMPVTWPEVTVADVDGRLAAGLQASLIGLPEWLEEPGTVSLDIQVKRTEVSLAFSAALEPHVIDDVRPLIEPLGGRLEIADGEATLWLPRA